MIQTPKNVIGGKIRLLKSDNSILRKVIRIMSKQELDMLLEIFHVQPVGYGYIDCICLISSNKILICTGSNDG